MLVQVVRVKLVASGMPLEQKHEYVDPESIQRIRESEHVQAEFPCCDLLVGGEWMTCAGTVEEFVDAAHMRFEKSEVA